MGDSSSVSTHDSSSSSDEEIQPNFPQVGGMNNQTVASAGLSNRKPAGAGDGSPHGSQHLIVEPRANDVLLGRGRPYQNFSGNKRMLKIISRYKHEYVARPRDQKRAFVEIVLDVVLKDGARFLRGVDDSDDENGSGRWEEVDRAAAAEKVWHALRCKDQTGRRAKKRKTGDETRSSEAPIAATTQGQTLQTGNTVGGIGGNLMASPSFQMLQMPLQVPAANTLSDVHALLRDMQHHLSHAITATNSLASVLTTARPPPFAFTRNPGAAPALAQTHELLRNLVPSMAPPMTEQYGGQPSFAFRYANMMGVASPPHGTFGFPSATPPTHPFASPNLHGTRDSENVSDAASTQQHNQAPLSTADRNAILTQALGILMQASQQFSPPPN